MLQKSIDAHASSVIDGLQDGHVGARFQKTSVRDHDLALCRGFAGAVWSLGRSFPHPGGRDGARGRLAAASVCGRIVIMIWTIGKRSD